MLFGLTALVYLAHGPMDKALLMALFGALLASVGLDPVTGAPRFTFNFLVLRDGIGLTPVVIGLFGVSEVLLNLDAKAGEIFQNKVRGLLPTMQDWRDSAAPIARGSLLGFFIGAIPGLNVVIATFASYALEKKLSKHPEKFGHGAIAGVAGPETANNAASCSGWIPLLSLGLPTGSVTSLIFGALMIHGLAPGPLFIQNSPQLFWGILGSMVIGNAMLLILNLPLIGLWIRVLRLPYFYLFPTDHSVQHHRRLHGVGKPRRCGDRDPLRPGRISDEKICLRTGAAGVGPGDWPAPGSRHPALAHHVARQRRDLLQSPHRRALHGAVPGDAAYAAPGAPPSGT